MSIFEENVKNNNRDLYEDTLNIITCGAEFMDSRNLEKICLDFK